MMFLLRTAFWLSVALALLPTFAPKQAATAPADLVASEAVTAASATVADMSKFCERRPDACTAGAQFASAFGQRARVGAQILYEFVGDRLKPDGAAASADKATVNVSAKEATKSSQNTLTSADIIPAWHGPSLRRDAATKRAT
jgi:hypothetical protein